MKNILIGTMSRGNADTPAYIRYLGKLGFESTEITFGHDYKYLAKDLDLSEYGTECRKACADSGMELSALGLYGNPLTGDESAKECIHAWNLLIDHAKDFGTDMICGFTGRVPDKPVEDSIPEYKAVFSDLAAHAKEKGVRIAFENCNMGGDWYHGTWNIAFNPKAWELMFSSLDADNIGLEWEPAHQIMQLIDPIPQLRKWAPKMFHIHGKDAQVLRNEIAENGILGGVPGFHRHPGLGKTNWFDVISILRQNHYTGNIDLEGWHDPVYRDELEMTGQLISLKYLKECRGDFVENFAK